MKKWKSKACLKKEVADLQAQELNVRKLLRENQYLNMLLTNKCECK
jgi:hypothetical protein